LMNAPAFVTFVLEFQSASYCGLTGAMALWRGNEDSRPTY